ncbi:MAG: flagellar assembly protein FliW [Firmicutes bacterium]|nr:flagellar assembly protein FliW [Bacillota bacterium]
MPKEGKYITFPAGIPGLSPGLNRFSLFALAADSPFFFLQSLQEEKVGFILVNPFFFFPVYEFELPDEEAKALEIADPSQVLIFCIVNAGRGLNNATVNLLAPIVVNAATGAARQVVLVDRRWSLRQPLKLTGSAASGPSENKTVPLPEADLHLRKETLRVLPPSPATRGSEKAGSGGEEGPVCSS